MNMTIFAGVVVILEVMVNEFFLEIFFEERRASKPMGKALRIIISSIFYRGWVWLNGSFFHLKLVGVILFFSFYAVWFFKAKWLQGLSVSVFIMSVAFGAEAIILFGCLPLFPVAIQERVFVALELSVKAIVWLMAVAARYIWLKNNEQRQIPKNIFPLLLFDTTLFGLTVFCVDCIQRENELSRILVPIIIGAFVLNICSFFSFAVIAHRESMLQELDRLNQKREMELAIYHSKKAWGERQARKTHDYKNQLLVISHMLETGSVEAVREYIGELTGSLTKEMDFINTNHSIINAVLNIKYREAKEKGITLNVRCSDLSQVMVEEEDLIVLLGNLLDNAIEACDCEDGDSYIQFKMILEKEQLLISTKNRSKNHLMMKNGRLISTKRDTGKHGIGTINIDAVAKKYGGIYVLRKEGEYVRAVVTLNIP